MQLKFRDLRADEVEVRVGTVSKEGKGASLLLYKDARCDMNILDETLGATGWKKHYELIDGQLFCTIEVWDDEKNQWIGKQDIGMPSDYEPEKGRASDAQKRSAFAFGIGRELYTAPFIWIPGASKYDKFWVKEMEIKDKKITKLTICRCDDYGNHLDAVAFSYPRTGPVRAKKQETPKATEAVTNVLRTPKIERIKAIYRGAALSALLEKYGVAGVDDLGDEQIDTILKNYDEWKEKKGAGN